VAPASVIPAAKGGEPLDYEAINTIRLLAADAVEAAQSGHPGLPMGCATAAYVLWTRFLVHDPSHPEWPDRDRFILSAGHGSMLLYALLNLTGYDLPMDELRRFRQWGSRTPGHPEHNHTPGVETTTGPLGQGLGNAVGMALAERMLAARYNHDGKAGRIVDHRTFVLASDGDMMEGISHEAGALAGHLGLGRLIVLYDDNRVSIDGPTSLAMSDDVLARFAAYGWHVQGLDDPASNDLGSIGDAVALAVLEQERPSLIALQTRIGYGAPTKEGLSSAHGAPLGAEELRGTKQRFGWPDEASFVVSNEVRSHVAAATRRGREAHLLWESRLAAWAQRQPELAAQWQRTQAVELPADLCEIEPDGVGGKPEATRVSSGRVLAALAPRLPELVGGSADLAESTNTAIPGGDVERGRFGGRVLRFGVREHAMGAILNGIALHRGLRLFGSTFLIFSDYMRPAIRLAALMRLPVILVLTHDSVALGEDGPTHQPVEHLAALRAIPGLAVLRPADAGETAWAWSMALRRSDGPTVLVLTRQAVPVLDGSRLKGLDEAGARIVRQATAHVDVVLVGTGSEVGVALAAADLLERRGVSAQVVSMPWRERFLLAPAELRSTLIPDGAVCVSVEAAHAMGWEAVTERPGRAVGIERFGASAPGVRVLEELGITPQAVAQRTLEVLSHECRGPSHRTADRRRGGVQRTPVSSRVGSTPKPEWDVDDS
jgi:transketolase